MFNQLLRQSRKFYNISERPLWRQPVGSASAARRQAILGRSSKIAQARSPSPLRERAVSAPAKGRDDRPVNGILHFRLAKKKDASVCRDAE